MAQSIISSTVVYHRKTEQLMKMAEIGRVAAIGHLVFLWLWADEHAEAGVLPKLTDWEIAANCNYVGDAKKFVNALIESGFLDRRGGRLAVHDYDQWLTKTMKQRLRRASDRASKVARNELQNEHAAESLPLPSSVLEGETKEDGKDAVKAERKKSPQEEFVLRFKAFYEQMVKQPFKYGRPHFVIAKKLIDEFGFDAVVEKTKVLARMCRDRSMWFTKAGWADFSIEKLSKQWNLIVAEAAPATKEDELEAEIRRRRESDELVNRVMGRK